MQLAHVVEALLPLGDQRLAAHRPKGGVALDRQAAVDRRVAVRRARAGAHVYVRCGWFLGRIEHEIRSQRLDGKRYGN